MKSKSILRLSTIAVAIALSSARAADFTWGGGTGYGFNGGNKLDTIHINGGLVSSQNQMTHLFGTTVNMTGGELRMNDGVSSPTGFRTEWNNSTVNTIASTSAATISGRIHLRNDGGYNSAVFNVEDGTATTDLLVSADISQTEARGVDRFANGLPEAIQKRLADQYAALFAIFVKHRDKVKRVTFWGLHDGGTWLNHFPSERTNHPLLWDRSLQPKPAFFAVLETARGRGTTINQP